MRLVDRSLILVFGTAILLPLATAPKAFAADESASPSPTATPSDDVSPSPSVEPSASPLPDALITLEPSTEVERFRTWSVAVTGGTASADVIEVEDMGSEISVAVFGASATVELTLAIPPELELGASCFDFDKQEEVGAVEPPDRLVLDVVQGGSYTCRYGADCAGPSPPHPAVFLYVSTDVMTSSQPWTISVAGGRALGWVGLCGTREISSLAMEPDPELPDWLFGSFSVEVLGESATVEITAPQTQGDGALPGAWCQDEDPEGRPRDVLVPARQLVFDVIPLANYTCYVEGRQVTLPPTDTLAERQPGPPSPTPLFLVVLVGVIAGTLLISVRARR